MRYQTAERVRHAAAELGYRKAYNDLMAIGFVQKVTAACLGVPGDVSVIGFDNIVDATLVEPQLTTIAAPQVRLGSAAVARVLKSSRREPEGRGAGPAARAPGRTRLDRSAPDPAGRSSEVAVRALGSELTARHRPPPTGWW